MATPQTRSNSRTAAPARRPAPTPAPVARRAAPAPVVTKRKAAPVVEVEEEEEEDPGFTDVEAADAAGEEQEEEQEQEQGEPEEYADVISMDLADPELKTNDGIRQNPPPGEYVVEITESKRKASKGNGTPMIEVTFTITDGDQAGNEVRGWYLIKDKKFWKERMYTLCTAAGVPIGRDGSFSNRALEGRRLMVTLTNEIQEITDKDTGEAKTVTNVRVGRERPIVAAKRNGRSAA